MDADQFPRPHSSHPRHPRSPALHRLRSSNCWAFLGLGNLHYERKQPSEPFCVG